MKPPENDVAAKAVATNLSSLTPAVDALEDDQTEEANQCIADSSDNRSLVTEQERDLDGLTTEQANYLMELSSTEENKGSSFSQWMMQPGETETKGEDGEARRVHVPVSNESLCSKAEELCAEARHEAGLEVPPAGFSSKSTPPEFVATGGTQSIVSWKGVSVGWFVEVFAETPEMRTLVEWDCPMWFVRNCCITVILRLRGVTEQAGCVLDNIDKFPSISSGDGKPHGDPICSTATVFVSYTGKLSLREFLKHMKDPKLKGAYIWTDVLCVDQFAWTQRRDDEMLAFKERFMYELHDWISKIDRVALLLDRWDDLTSTLGQIWVIWELFSCTQGNANLSILFAKDEEERFIDEGLGSSEGINRILASLAAIDARNAKAFRAEDRTLILSMMESEANGVFDVNAKVAGLFREWLLETGRAKYEASVRNDNWVMVHHLAVLYREMGHFGRAKVLAKRHLVFCQETYGLKHRETLFPIINLASILSCQGKEEEAEKFCRQGLEIRRSLFGIKHPDTLSSVSHLALLLKNQGKLEEAAVLCKPTLESQRELLGNRHTETLRTIIVMGKILIDQGKLEEAEPLHREALEINGALLGNKHPDTVGSVHALANVLRKLGSLEEAYSLFQQALEVQHELLGNKHPNTLLGMHYMANMLYDQGKFEEAERLQMEALEGQRELLGNKHAETLISVCNMALFLSNQGKLEEAEPFCNEALNGQREVLGDTHPNTLTSINNLALLLYKRGKLSKAEVLLREGLKGMRDLLGDKHPDTLASTDNLAAVLFEQGNVQEAETLCREALAGRRLKLGDEHQATLNNMRNLASMLATNNKFSEAEPWFHVALTGMRQHMGDDHPLTLSIASNYVKMLEMWHDLGYPSQGT